MNFVTKILKYLNLYHFGILFTSKSYLNSTGWANSFKKNKPLDCNGNPLPWMTYPFIEFLKNRLNKNITVFEYGGGNSTIWFAKYVKNIISVENDQSWVEHINKFLPSNAQLLYRDTHNISYSDLSFAPIGKPSSYSQTINETKQKYDIIIIDGVDRNNCIVNSLQNLSDIGIIIVDNFEFKDKMSVALNVLYDKGFKTIEFWGLSPMIFNQSCTTVFYKAQNCLNI